MEDIFIKKPLTELVKGDLIYRRTHDGGFRKILHAFGDGVTRAYIVSTHTKYKSDRFQLKHFSLYNVKCAYELEDMGFVHTDTKYAAG